MFALSEIVSYFKEVSQSLKFQLSAALTFGVALILLWLNEGSYLKLLLSILFMFPASMFVGSVLEKIVKHIRKKKEQKQKMMEGKLGLLGALEYTDKLDGLWQDKNFEGLGWQVYIDEQARTAYLNQYCCFSCKTDLIPRVNAKVDGFYLECQDCKKKFDVDDIGEKRALANASLQGDVRRNPRKYFLQW